MKLSDGNKMSSNIQEISKGRHVDSWQSMFPKVSEMCLASPALLSGHQLIQHIDLTSVEFGESSV